MGLSDMFNFAGEMVHVAKLCKRRRPFVHSAGTSRLDDSEDRRKARSW